MHLFDVYNLSKNNIDELLNASNCVIIIDSLELIKDRSFIDKLAVRSRTKDIKLYVSAFCTDMLGSRFLTNINNLSIGYLGQGQTLKTALSDYEKKLEQLRQQNKNLSDKLNSAEDEIKVLTKSNETLIETNKSLANSLKVVEDLVDSVKSDTVLTAITKLSEYKRVS